MRVESLYLNLIVALEAIVRLRSVSAAAQELRLTQPAVSRALSRLREHFGDQLAVPVGRRMAPTAFGAELFARATELLHETRAFAQQRPGFNPVIAVREFTVAASDYVSAIFLTKVFRKLASAAPGLSIRIVSADIVSQTMIDRGDLDFVIMPEMVLSARHPREELFRDTFVCAVWSGNPLVKDGLDFANYMALGHVSTAFGPARDSHFEHFLRTSGISVRVVLSMPSFTQIPQFLVGTPYVATIHARLANTLPPEAPLKFFPVPIDVPPLREHLQWHRMRQHDAASNWLRVFMHEVAAEEM